MVVTSSESAKNNSAMKRMHRLYTVDGMIRLNCNSFAYAEAEKMKSFTVHTDDFISQLA